MADFQALCAELLDWAERTSSHYVVPPDVILRARAALAKPEPQGLTVMEIIALADEVEEEGLGQVDLVRRALARYGRPAVEPVPVSERLPGPEECTTNPRTGQGQWCWGWVQHDDPPYSGRWRMMRREWLASEAMAWLPHWALPVPKSEAGQ